MNTFIGPNTSKFNAGNSHNKRDSVYKSQNTSDNSFYALYDETIRFLKTISTYENKTVISRELIKINSKVKTLIDIFFKPTLLRLKEQTDVNDSLSLLTNTYTKLMLSTLPYVQVQKQPAPKDHEMLNYIDEFLHHASLVIPMVDNQPSNLNTHHGEKIKLGNMVKPLHNALREFTIRFNKRKRPRQRKISFSSNKKTNL